uniref:Uncharacterized protein n=1 Tax=Anguilla anguilla TaxID=7936 RepID=A0A0E9Y0S2_ANGAN
MHSHFQYNWQQQQKTCTRCKQFAV